MILALGDIHGFSEPIDRLYRENKKILDQEKNNVLILLGDAGLNYYLDEQDQKFKKELGQYPFTYFVVRGNHEQRASVCAKENPSSWHISEFFRGLVWQENDFPYIKYALDFINVYDIGGYKALILPGAYSPDKEIRLKYNMHYFPEEQLTEAEKEVGLEIIKQRKYTFDLVLSHTCPIKWLPLDLLPNTYYKVDRSMENYFSEIEKQIKYKLWLFGHYHDTRVGMKMEDLDNQTKRFVMLYDTHAIRIDEWMNGGLGQWY